MLRVITHEDTNIVSSSDAGFCILAPANDENPSVAGTQDCKGRNTHVQRISCAASKPGICVLCVFRLREFAATFRPEKGRTPPSRTGPGLGKRVDLGAVLKKTSATRRSWDPIPHQMKETRLVELTR